MDDIELKIIELYKEIYEIRKNSDIQRQDVHSDDYKFLDNCLRQLLNVTYPYLLSFGQKSSLGKSVLAYQRCGNGLPAKVAPQGFLYRIATPIDVFVNTQINFPVEEIDNLAMELWNRLYELSEGGEKWLDLSEHGSKPYMTLGQISWWTSNKLDDSNTDIIDKGTKLGLFANWITDESYLLCCISDICDGSDIASVPTIIDAYANTVFYTTENAKNPSEGTTINLSQFPHLDLGMSEFVLKKIDLRCIKIKPVRIEKADRRRHKHIQSKDVKMLESLKTYYQSMP